MTLSAVPPTRRRGRDGVIAWTLSLFRPYARPTAALAAFSIAEIVLRALLPWPMKMLVDRVLAASVQPVPVVSAILGRVSRPALLLGVVVAGVLLQLTHQLVLMLHTRMQSRIAARMVFDLRARLFSHLQYVSLTHHVNHPTSDSVYRLDQDAGCLENLLLRGLFPLVFSALTLVVMFAILVRLDRTLAIVSMVAVPFLYLNLRLYMGRVGSRAERAKELESRVVGRLHESLNAIRVVKTFAREEHEVAQWSGVATAAVRERLAVTRQESLFSFFVGSITMIGSSLVLAIGGLHVLDGTLTLGTLLVVVAYLGFVYGPLSAIATTIGSLHHALASARRVRQVFDLERETDSGASAIQPARVRGEVRFDGVSFAYGPGRPVLHEISFTAKPGETVALVGLSGAGKSTLVSLLGRLHEPTGGRVLIDGLDIRRYPLRWLREQIAVVLQEAILFSGSIGENILYGRLDASDHEVVLAARAAQCEEFIARLRRGFDTPIGEAGGGLSGGQRQRLSIARAFLKDAPILILDEPTAALDTLSERAILTALWQLRKNRTTFVIAHRLSTVRDADRILVLDQGRIAAAGTHAALLASSELYRQLCTQLDPHAQEVQALANG